MKLGVVICCSENDFKIKDRILAISKKYFRADYIMTIPPRTGIYTYWLSMAKKKINPGDVAMIVKIKKDPKFENKIMYSAAAFTLNHGCMVYFDYINQNENEEVFKRQLQDKIRNYANVHMICSYYGNDCQKYANKIEKSIKCKHSTTFQGSIHDRVKGALLIGKNRRIIDEAHRVYFIKELADFGVRPENLIKQ